MGYPRLGLVLVALLLTSACAGQRLASPPAGPVTGAPGAPSGSPAAKLPPAAPRAPTPAPPSLGYEETGEASWYGNPYHGRRAASGEIYDMNQMTAAHRTLPFDTRVWVESLVDGSGVELRINDRGPFKDPERRIIDVSYAAARLLGVVGPGVIPVRLRVVALPGAARSGSPPATAQPPGAASAPAVPPPAATPAPAAVSPPASPLPTGPPMTAAPGRAPLSESSPPVAPPATPVSRAESSSTGGSPAPREAAVAPREAAPAPRETVAPPREAAAAPHEAAPAPRQAAAAPREAAPAPREVAPAPREAVPAPREAAPTPREAAPAPRVAAVTPGEAWTLQLAAYSTEARAMAVRDDLARAWPETHVQKGDVGGRPVWRVRVGRYPTRRDAEEAARRLAAAGHRPIVVEAATR